jgi:hypothetical protein
MAQLTMGGIPLTPFLTYRQEQSQSDMYCFLDCCILIITMAQEPHWAKAPSLLRIHDCNQTHHTQ